MPKGAKRRLANPASFRLTEVELLRFYDRVGMTMYDRDWKDGLAKVGLSLGPHPVQSDENKAQRAWEEMCSALAAGSAKAIISLSLPLTSAIAEERFHQKFDGFLDRLGFKAMNSRKIVVRGRRPRGLGSLGLPLEFWQRPKKDVKADLEEIKKRKVFIEVGFIIKSEFWFSDDCRRIDLLHSQGQIPYQYLLLEKLPSEFAAYKQLELAEIFDFSFPPPNARISIIGSDSGIENMIKLSLPPDEWFDRLDTFRLNFVPELIAAAWRFIAIEKLKPQHGSGRKIIDAMLNYAARHGLNQTIFKAPKEDTIKKLGYKILHQLEAEEKEAPVIVDSSREHSKK